jgi:Coiled-coil N-terminus of cGMP-dependent protein kinase
MRLCFKGFCLGPQRPSAVDQSVQTTLTQSTAVETLNITTFFDKSASTRDATDLPKRQVTARHASSTTDFFEKFRMINPEDVNFPPSGSDFNSSANNSTMFSHNSDNNSVATLPPQFLVDSSDSQNNNLLNSSSQIELVKHDAVDLLNNTVENIYINDCTDINMQDIEQQLTDKERDLIKVIQLKDVRISELQQQVLQKDDEIANLKSHLDKFQSVFSGFRSGAMGRKIGRNIQRQRVGISAEPQSESSMRDLLSVTFPKYEKEEP